MAPVDWKEAWRAGRTPWDEGKSPPALRRLLDEGRVPDGRVFVPGCGAGYDLATLASDRRHVIGLDLSANARDAFDAANRDLPGQVDYEVGDFFTYTPESPFDFIWDYTFFCALDPEQRGAWGAATARLLRPGGILATLLFPYADPIPEREGPPWPINTRVVEEIVDDAFTLLEVRDEPRTHPGREGKERLALWQRH